MPERRQWTSNVASQVGRNRTGAGVSASGSFMRGRSTSAMPCSSRYTSSSMDSATGSSRARGHAGPAGSIDHGRRPERLQVTRQQQPQSVNLAGDLAGDFSLLRIGRHDPLIGEPIPIGTTTIPCAGRRHPDHVDPQTGTLPKRLGKAGALQSLRPLQLAAAVRRPARLAGCRPTSRTRSRAGDVIWRSAATIRAGWHECRRRWSRSRRRQPCGSSSA